MSGARAALSLSLHHPALFHLRNRRNRSLGLQPFVTISVSKHADLIRAHYDVIIPGFCSHGEEPAVDLQVMARDVVFVLKWPVNVICCSPRVTIEQQ